MLKSLKESGDTFHSSSLHSRNNRFSKLNFLTPRYRLKTEGGSTFLVTAIEQWNMLGADLKKEVTVKSQVY